MRTILPLFTLVLLSCSRSPCPEEIVCETYIHPYGLEISSEEWHRQGSSGEVIVTHKDGVTIKSSYKEGELEGEVAYSFPYRDVIERVETYREGKLVKESEYFSSGIKKREIEYPTDEKKVVYHFYDQGGRKSEEHFTKALLEKALYYTTNDLVESKVDNFEGKVTNRDLYGQLISVDTIQKGALTSSTTYYANGMPEAITPYRDGQVEGVRKTYFPGGEPLSVEKWKEGVKHGVTTLYEGGEKIAEIPYVEGVRQGVERHFCDDGKLAEEITWSNDVQHGPKTRYIEDRVIVDYYYLGNPVTKSLFDKRSALLQPQR